MNRYDLLSPDPLPSDGRGRKKPRSFSPTRITEQLRDPMEPVVLVAVLS